MVKLIRNERRMATPHIAQIFHTFKLVEPGVALTVPSSTSRDHARLIGFGQLG